MDVSISARHVNVTPRLEEVIREKIGTLDRFLDGLQHAEVHFDEARNPRIEDKEFLEVVVEGHGHHLRAKVNARDPYSAGDGQSIRTFDTAAIMEDLSGQPAGGVATIVEEDVVEDDALPEIVKSKRFYLAPMTPEDAILKMDLLGHGFFFFINKDTNRSAVIYKRDDGDIGLIDEAG